MQTTPTTTWRRAATRITALSGWSLIFWGAWAFAANLGYGLDAAARAGLTQGASSLTLTFLMTLILECVSRQCRGPAAKVLGPALTAVAFHASLTIGAHWAAGTPALLASVAPLIAAGVAYALAYSSALALAAHPELPILQRLLQITQGLRGGAPAPSPRCGVALSPDGLVAR